MIRKELDESKDDYEGTIAQKPQFDRSDMKRTIECVSEIPAMIDDNPSKSIRSIARNIGVFQFLIGKLVQQDIRYFSYNIRRGNFYYWSWRTREKTALQSLLRNSSILTWSVPTTNVNQIPIHIMVFEVVTSDGYVTPPFIFPQTQP